MSRQQRLLQRIPMIIIVLAVHLPTAGCGADRQQRAIARLEQRGCEVLRWHEGFYIDLRDNRVTDDLLNELQGIQSEVYIACSCQDAVDLQRLRELDALVGIHLGNSQIDGKAWEVIVSVSQLRVLTVHSKFLRDCDLAAVGQLKQLARLDLGKTQVGKETVKAISCLERLQHLNLQDTSLTDQDMILVTSLSKLEELFMAGTAISDEGLATISALKNLKVLELADTSVSDLGMKYLRELQGLETLYIGGTAVTETGLQALCNLPNLREVYAGGTSIRSQAAKRALPGVNIYCD